MSSISNQIFSQGLPTFNGLTGSVNTVNGTGSLLSTTAPADVYTASSGLANAGSNTVPFNRSTLMSSMLALMLMMLQMITGGAGQSTGNDATASTTSGTGQSSSSSSFAKLNLSNIESYYNQDDPTLAHIDDPPPQPAPDDSEE